MTEREDNEKRQKIRLQKTATARLKVVKPNRPVVDGENPDETVLSEPEENNTAQQPTDKTTTDADTDVEAPKGQETVASLQTEPAKTNTAQLNIVQQKKKELDERIKAHNTVRLKAPIKPDTDAADTATTAAAGATAKTEAPGSETIKMSSADTESEKTAAIKPDTGDGAKRTLKMKRPVAGRTVKMGGAAKSKGTMKLSAADQDKQEAAKQSPAHVAAKAAEEKTKDQPGPLYTLGAVVTLAACAVLTFLLASQYLEYFKH